MLFGRRRNKVLIVYIFILLTLRSDMQKVSENDMWLEGEKAVKEEIG